MTRAASGSFRPLAGALAVFAAVAVVMACTTSTAPPSTAPVLTLSAPGSPAPNASAAFAKDAASSVASAASASRAPSPADVPGVAWTDPSVVAALRDDCNWERPSQSPENPDPLSCDLEFEQSCVPDPCFDEGDQTCRPACRSSCTGCAGTCKESCRACKTACTDESCKSACSSRCGACRQACVQAKDQCATGTCGQQYKACTKRLAAQWKRNGCLAECPAVSACVQRCFADAGADFGGCSGQCAKTLMKRCPSEFQEMCMMGATPGG
jgi:hypothetical protein